MKAIAVNLALMLPAESIWSAAEDLQRQLVDGISPPAPLMSLAHARSIRKNSGENE